MPKGIKLKISKEINDELISIHKEKKTTVVDLAKEFNIGTNYIYNLFRKNNIKLEKFKTDNPQKKWTRLSKEIKESIIKDYIDGMMVKDIGIKYDINLTTVNKIRKEFDIEQNDLRIKINENYFENIDTPDKAWVLGFITGDGCISKDNNKCVIDLSRKDIEILEKIKKYIHSDHKIYNPDILDKRTNKIYKHSILVLSRKKICEDLEKLGVTNKKSSVLNIPDIPEFLMKDYIRGLFCSDGWFHIDNSNTLNFGICSSVSGFLEKIQIILEKECSLNKVKISYDTGNYKLIYNGNNITKRIFNYLYSDYNENNYPCLERKYKYAKLHFEKLDLGIKSRNPEDSPVSLF